MQGDEAALGRERDDLERGAGDDPERAFRADEELREVRADGVADPVAVRYAWADNPVCNLYNSAGLPATPFRTDDWPGVTAPKP